MQTTRFMVAVVLSVGSLLGSLAACGDDAAPKLGLGETCTANAACASGMCFASPEGASYCSTDCAGAALVCGEADVELYCGPEQLCERPCTSLTRGTGASMLACVDGVFAACAGLDPADACVACGCEPFGGGRCTTHGCFTAMPDGAPCTHRFGCQSNVCNADTDTCGMPRALGEACGDDFECETHNCSNDGDVGSLGVCFQEFKSACLTANPTHCELCIEAASGPVCWREFCNEDPLVMANCPDFANQQWGCAADNDGRRRCRVRCASNFDCDAFDDCSNDGYCR